MKTLRIDLHHYRVEAAYDLLMRKIDEAISQKIYVIEVIHGYNHGNALRTMVQSLTKEDHPDILRVRLGLSNSGTSYIDLKMSVF